MTGVQTCALPISSSEIIVPASYSLVLNQTGALPLGGSTLSLSGAGKLKFENAINVTDGELEVSSGTLDFVSGGSVAGLTLESATLVLSDDLTVGDNLTTSGTDPTLQLNGTLDLTGTGVQMQLGTGLVLDNVSTSANTGLLLTADATLTRGSPFTLGSINLQNKALTLGSGTSDMTVTGAVTFGTSSSQILTGDADLTLQSASVLNLADGKLSSTGGTLSLPQGLTLGSGAIFDFSGSTAEFSGTLNVGDGTITSSSSSILELQAASSFTSTDVFTIPTLELNGQGLTLNTSSTHLTLSNPFTVGSSESVDTQAGSLTLNGSATLEDNGTIESSAGSLTFNGSVALDSGGKLLLTGGSVALNSGAAISGGELKLFDSSLTLAGNVGMTNDSTLSLKNTVINPGSYTIGMTGGTLGLGGTYSDFGAVQTDNTTSLELNANASITRSALLEIGGLDLNNFALTLGSATTDLTIQSSLVLDSTGSQLITNVADLILTYPLQLTAGSITSTAGTFSLSQGGTLGSSGILDVSGTTLKLSDNLSAESGTLTSNSTSVLHLLDDVTLTFNGEKTFKALEHNGKTLTLGSATSDLELIDPLTLNAGTLHTQGADLNLQGALTLDNNSLIDSTGGTLTLGGAVDNSSELTVPGTALALRSDFAITGTLSTGTGTTISRNNNELDLSGGLLKLGGDLNLAGTVTDNDTRLILQADATLGNSASTGIGSLDLNGSALTISMAMTINDPLTLDTAGEQILTGAADLSLNGGISVNAGTLSSSGGTVSASSLSAGAAGTLNFQGGTLSLPGGATAVSGA